MIKYDAQKIDYHLAKSATAKTLKKRIKHRNKAVEILTDVFKQIENNQNTLIDKLANAATSIKEQDDWINCLYIAMKSNKEEIIKTAIILKQNNKGAYNEVWNKLRRP